MVTWDAAGPCQAAGLSNEAESSQDGLAHPTNALGANFRQHSAQVAWPPARHDADESSHGSRHDPEDQHGPTEEDFVFNQHHVHGEIQSWI